MKEAVVIQMTWPGAPTLYYGDEAGLCGFTDPDNRRTYPWGKEDKVLIRFHQGYDSDSSGKSCTSHRLLSSFCAEHRNILCYARFNRAQQFIIVVNNDGYTRSMEIGVCGAGVPSSCQMTQIMYSSEDNYSMAPGNLSGRKKLSETDASKIFCCCVATSVRRGLKQHI